MLDGDEANPRIKLFENFGAAVQALIAGDVDMVLMDAASSRGYIGANPDKLEVIGDPLGTEEFGFIFTPDSDLVAPFNQAIADDAGRWLPGLHEHSLVLPVRSNAVNPSFRTGSLSIQWMPTASPLSRSPH